MSHRSRSVAAFAAIALIAGAVPAGAQSWQTFTPANGTAGYTNPQGYWNNLSDDVTGGSICNIGAVLTTGVTACTRQSPAGFLPLNTGLTSGPGGNALVLQGVNGAPVAFQLGAGTWRFDLLGRIAGAEVPGQSNLLVYNTATGMFTSLTGGSPVTITTTGTLLLALDSWNPADASQRRFLSNMTMSPSGNLVGTPIGGPQQFAVFGTAANAPFTTFGATTTLGFGGTYWFGAEDNACDNPAGVVGVISSGPCLNTAIANSRGRYSDRDYNDFILRATSVPEPSTYALMGTGLLGIAGLAARRRRSTVA